MDRNGCNELGRVVVAPDLIADSFVVVVVVVVDDGTVLVVVLDDERCSLVSVSNESNSATGSTSSTNPLLHSEHENDSMLIRVCLLQL